MTGTAGVTGTRRGGAEVQARDLRRAQWRKSSYSSANGQCVEVACLAEAVAVRDSKHPDGPNLVFARQEWATFIAGLKNSGSTYI